MTPLSTGLPELLPALHELSRADKLRLIQLLAADLASNEGVSGLESGTAYPLWTPYGACGAAASLLAELEKEGAMP